MSYVAYKAAIKPENRLIQAQRSRAITSVKGRLVLLKIFMACSRLVVAQ